MRKILLFAVAAILLASCTNKQTFDPRTIAEQCMREHAYHPDQLKVLSCTATLIPDTTIISTSYHIATVDGQQISNREWINVTAVYIDSVKVTHTFLPKHYYCCATIECVNDCENVVHETVELAVLPNDSAIMFYNYQKRYYKSVCDTVYVQRDTLTDVREYIGYLPEWNGWVVQQMLLNFYAPKDEKL